MADAFVLVPMDMAQDLRQWGEALSLVENWLPNSRGSAVLRRYKALLDDPTAWEGSLSPGGTASAFGPPFATRREREATPNVGFGAAANVLAEATDDQWCFDEAEKDRKAAVGGVPPEAPLRRIIDRGSNG